MKLFLSKSVSFLLIIFGITIFSILVLINSSDKSLLKEQTTIIAGDSNTECALNDQKIKSALNISRSGESYFYTYYKLRYLIRNNENFNRVYLSFSPHNIISKENRLTSDGRIYNNLIEYSPVLDLESIYYLFKMDKKNAFLSFFKSPIYLLKNKNLLWGGYIYLVRNNLDKSIRNSKQYYTQNYTQNNIDQIEVMYLKKISTLLDLHDIELILLNTPKWTEFYKFSNSRELFDEVYENYFSNTKFLDYSDIFSKEEFFGDFIHLNFKGSQEFTDFFNREIVSTADYFN